MAVYDPEPEHQEDVAPKNEDEQQKSLSPEEIGEREAELGDRYNSKGGELKRRLDSGLGRHAKVRDASLAADAQERADLNNRLHDTASGLADTYKEAGFFKQEGKKGIFGKLRSRGNRRNVIIGGGLIGLVLAAFFGLFGFLNAFRLDQILNSLDQQTFARFNASFDRRSDAWFRSYIRLRLAEWGGDYNAAGGENLYFRSDKVDRDNPVRDWYRTLRTSSFEKDLFEKQGIRFTSILTPDGQIRTGKITINNKDIPFDVLKLDGVDAGKLANGDLDQLNRVGPYVDGLIDAEVFGSDKEARRLIKQAVNDNTRSYQVFRRRHLRKDIANMTGVREWRLFEKTRDKIDNARIGIQRKIINKVFSGDANSLRFLNCLLGGSRCPNTSDPADPENLASTAPSGELDPADQRTGPEYNEDGSIKKDSNGNPLTGSTDSITREVGDTISDTIAETSEEVIQNSSLSERIIKNLAEAITKLAGGPAAIWDWAQRLAAIHNLFGGGENSTIVKLIKNARLVQLIGLYTATSIARDQIKKGELVGDELNGFYAMTRNFSDSEAWAAVGSSYDATKASAAETTDVSKEEYCRSDYDRKFEQYAWYCDSFKPNGGSTGEKIAESYFKTIGWMIAPIAAVVNGVNKLPIIGPIINKVNEIVSSIVGLLGDAFMATLRAIGLADNVEGIIASAVSWLSSFVGAAPFVDPEEPGFAAWLVGGSAGSAESTTRWSGGVGSTKTTYKYSKQLASSYKQEHASNMSWSDRYISLGNPDSLTSNLALAASNVTAGENLFSKVVGAFTNLPNSIFSSFSRRTEAADSELAILAGVDMYDIPEQCINLDPLDPEYLLKATNANIPNLSYAILTNADIFWAAVYNSSNIQPVDKEQIYNCALLDTRTRGSLGYLYGYADDGGLGD